MDDGYILKAEERMKILLRSAFPQPVNPAFPINRYYRSLNEIYRVAGFCLTDDDLEKAFIYYMRFICLALEELPKHPCFNGFSSAEKTKAEAFLLTAVQTAEILKSKLKKKFEEDAIREQAEYHRRQSLEAEQAAMKKLAQEHTQPIDYLSNNVSDNRILFDSREKFDKPSSSTDSRSSKETLISNIVVAGNLIAKFTKAAEVNTLKNVETCAVLCGTLAMGNTYNITHAVVPKQKGAPDCCETFNEEDVFAYQDSNNLITLGWIHTHPSQTAFLSSVDLHTHYSYQLMLPEAIAIVVAPKFDEIGVFRLSENGMKVVGNCFHAGFHLHEDSAPNIYHHHSVQYSSQLEAKLIDLR